MPKFAEFLNCSDVPKAEKAFLLEYQKAVLLTLLKEGVIRAEKEMEEYREKLAPRGYRTWTNAAATATLFARLQRYDEEHQKVYLKEYGGKITKVALRRLCKEDCDYVLKQQEEKEAKKKKRKSRKAV